jgi:hypothetical protein
MAVKVSAHRSLKGSHQYGGRFKLKRKLERTWKRLPLWRWGEQFLY